MRLELRRAGLDPDRDVTYAVETMVSLRAIPQRLNPADLVDVSGLPSQP